MATVLITGGTGMIGSAISHSLLQKGHEIIILTRDARGKTPPSKSLSYAEWNIAKQVIDPAAIAKADHIIHLAGANVFEKRWTQKRKSEIVSSRVESSELLVKSVSEIPNHIRTVVSASAIGWYGEGGPFKENAPHADNFLGETCRQWEASISPMSDLGKRLVILRTGIALSRSGGALVEFIKPLKWGVATILGNGQQIISWIHIDDLVSLYVNAIENAEMKGIYNAVATHPVTNKQLVLTLARQSNGRKFIPVQVPSFLLKTVLGEKSIEVLKSALVSNEKLLKFGFQFQFPTIEIAIKDLMKRTNP